MNKDRQEIAMEKSFGCFLIFLFVCFPAKAHKTHLVQFNSKKKIHCGTSF